MTNPSRRSVLRAGVVVAAAAVPLGVARQAFSVVAGGMASGLRRSAFQPHLRSTLTLAGNGGTHRAVLTRIDDLSPDDGADDLRFRLMFRVSRSRPAQGTYTFARRGMAPVALFITPVGAKPGVYEAIIDARR